MLILGTHKYSWLDVSGRSCGRRAKMYVDHDCRYNSFCRDCKCYFVWDVIYCWELVIALLCCCIANERSGYSITSLDGMISFPCWHIVFMISLILMLGLIYVFTMSLFSGDSCIILFFRRLPIDCRSSMDDSHVHSTCIVTRMSHIVCSIIILILDSVGGFSAAKSSITFHDQFFDNIKLIDVLDSIALL